MTKTLRASVSFPAALHRSLKLAVAGANPRVSLTDYVLRAVEASGGINYRIIEAAYRELVYDDKPIRSTVKFPYKLHSLATNRAMTLGMSTSQFIAAVVAHKLNGNGK